MSEKFKLNYSGRPSVFEARISAPRDFDEVKLQVLAADQAGNHGHHSLVYKILP